MTAAVQTRGLLKRAAAFVTGVFGIARSATAGLPATPVRTVRARYDSAQTDELTRRHWALVDAFSADAANSSWVRRILRIRSRYEVANNCILQGAVLTLANDVIGMGPRLQFVKPVELSERKVKQVTAAERSFERWIRKAGLAEKLRTGRIARAQDGETFGIRFTNPKLDHPVKLDMRVVEADQVAQPYLNVTNLDSLVLDGIELDEWGNPLTYNVLKSHPGSTGVGAFAPSDSERYPAECVSHIFRQERAGQHRGIPEVKAALQSMPMLRRYTLATLGAAEAAADFAGVMKTDSPADDEGNPAGCVGAPANEKIYLERNTLVTLPEGWDMRQIEPTQPTTTYPAFKREIVSEAARCMLMPFNVMAGDSSDYNYASGRLDHHGYFKAIDVDRDLIEIKCLDPLLADWLREYELITGVTIDLDWEWYWPGHPHIDPLKEASAQEIKLRIGTTNLAKEYGQEGEDWEAGLRQSYREKAAHKRFAAEFDVDVIGAPAPSKPAADRGAGDEGGDEAEA